MVSLQEEIQTCNMYNEQITQDLTRKRLQDTNILLQAMRRMLKSKQSKHLLP